MPKIVSAAEYVAVLHAVRKNPGGAAIEVIQAFVGERTARRTLQRRLRVLVTQGELIAEGRKRGTLYRLPLERALAVRLEEPAAASAVAPDEAQTMVPMSADGSRQRDLVRRPLTLRTPVGYRREFLIAYRPNETWYLPGPRRIHQIGRAHV